MNLQVREGMKNAQDVSLLEFLPLFLYKYPGLLPLFGNKEIHYSLSPKMEKVNVNKHITS